MHKALLSSLATLIMIAGCQATPPAHNGPAAATTSTAVAATGSPNRQEAGPPTPDPSPRAEQPAEIASWETSYPFSIASLIERRLKGVLVADDRRRIDVAAARALAGEHGTLHRWRTDERNHRGVVRLVRRTAPEGRVCARLHHEHRFERRALRGSVRICRQRGDIAAPWTVDDVRWIRLGSDLAGSTVSPGSHGAPSS